MGDLYRHEYHREDSATIEIDPATRAKSSVDPRLYGKFSEHLAWNIYHGMDAQIIFNPTFGRWRFRAATPTEDGGYVGSMDPVRREKMIEEHAHLKDYPRSESLQTAVQDGLSFWWQRRGDSDAVTVSPDVGQFRDRAQRIEIQQTTPKQPRGIIQWIYLPLQRTQEYEYSITIQARANTAAEMKLAFHSVDESGAIEDDLAATEIEVHADWQTLEGTLSIPDEAAPADDDLVAISLTAVENCNVVVDRLLLYPDDHIDYADPDVIEFFRDAGLPLLRWPGGNFGSDYDWRDGIGPRPERPTNNNPAWGGIEPNLFGTVEFIQFCEAVGCEPMICVNAGTGTPAEAAKWVEYCNSDDSTEMGQLRADHGHPEPFDVEYWEIGNELYGQYQPNWTTPDGYVDRYKRFRTVMLQADPDINVLACGTEGEWNERLIAEAASEIRSITDHPLVGSPSGRDDDLDQLYHTLMGATQQLDRRIEDLGQRMRNAGIDDPRQAITELQITVSHEDTPNKVLSPPWHGSRYAGPSTELPGKKSIAEAIWDASIIHNSIRQDGLVELITHTGAVNHGGGLQKQKEHVWADPCHYGHAMGTVLIGKTPVGVDVGCDTVSVETDAHSIETVDEYPILDAVAAVDEEELSVMLVHRGSGVGDIDIHLDTAGLATQNEAEITTLSGDSMSSENTIDEPECIIPEGDTVAFEGSVLRLTLPEYALTSVVAAL